MEKTIFRIQKDKNNPYVMLNKTFLNDEKLSLKAKGLLAYLLSLPDDWQIYENELIKHHTDKRDSIRTAIKELIEAGYIERERKRDNEGHLREYQYYVYEMPKTGKNDLNPDGCEDSTYIGFPNIGKTNIGKSNTTNNNLTNNNKTNSNSSTTTKENLNISPKEAESLILKNKTPKNKQQYKDEIVNIIEYFNLKANTKYQVTDSSIYMITKLLNMNKTIDDIKKVIDYKFNNLKTDMDKKYWRPSTFFGLKYFINCEGRMFEDNFAGEKINTTCAAPIKIKYYIIDGKIEKTTDNILSLKSYKTEQEAIDALNLLNT